MRANHTWLALALCVGLCGLLAGCAESATAPVAEAPAEMEAGHEGHNHNVDPQAVLASLKPHEQEVAKAQDMKCIVAGEPLGSMGPPVLVANVEGHDFLICCQGCEEELRKDPAKYIAKLGDKADATKTEAPADAPAEPAGENS